MAKRWLLVEFTREQPGTWRKRLASLVSSQENVVRSRLGCSCPVDWVMVVLLVRKSGISATVVLCLRFSPRWLARKRVSAKWTGQLIDHRCQRYILEPPSSSLFLSLSLFLFLFCRCRRDFIVSCNLIFQLDVRFVCVIGLPKYFIPETLIANRWAGWAGFSFLWQLNGSC